MGMRPDHDSITLAGMLERGRDRFGRYIFLIVDTRAGSYRPWLVWADGKEAAIECVGLYDKWRGDLPA